MQNRRYFLESLSRGTAGVAFTAGGLLTSSLSLADEITASDFVSLTRNLLTDWCDGMIRHQISEPSNPGLHGALACPACRHIHGRCSDAIYPFLHMAHVTGEQKYLDAAINVYNWAEKNLSQPDGSWTNDINPKAWRGTTIFGAIALAEALHYHGDVLDKDRRAAWTKRLDKAAGGYLYRDFKTIDFTNLNYGMTGIYGFGLFGRLLGKQKYIARSHQLSKRLKEFFTEPNKLIWGEGKPNNNLSGRGLLPVDLGYNVEESLNGAVLYALEENDKELIELLVESMKGHLEFMLPDGAWDNSWGTRSAKWTYWGSRTSDGCQPAFSMMAAYNPVFGTAAFKNAELLQRCTADGLLHGGPHYVSHGIKPCIHHTFTHAKVMALVQDKKDSLPKIEQSVPLPRERTCGVKHFPELAVWLVALRPWRATISAYDSIYKTKSTDHLQQPTGGSLALLYHEKVGTLLAGSMARYILVEPLNQQPNPGMDFPLTPRIETHVNGTWYTNLYDLKAEVEFSDDGQQIAFDVKTTLQNEDRDVVPQGPAEYKLSYQFDNEQLIISAEASKRAISGSPTALVVPIISPSAEEVRQISETRIEIDKPDGTVVVEGNAPLSIKDSPTGRVFNMVPGAEAVPIFLRVSERAVMKATCTISVV